MVDEDVVDVVAKVVVEACVVEEVPAGVETVEAGDVM